MVVVSSPFENYEIKYLTQVRYLIAIVLGHRSVAASERSQEVTFIEVAQ